MMMATSQSTSASSGGECLGVAPDILERVLEVHPRWDPKEEKLRVKRSLLFAEHGPQKIADVIETMLSFRNFSDTRWGQVGPCARQFMLGLSIGLPHLVSLVDRFGCNNDRVHLTAARSHMTAEVRLYLALACVSAYPAETFLGRMMHDDRLLLHAGRCWSDMMEEVAFVEGLSDSFWARLAQLVSAAGVCRVHIKHLALQAMWTSIAYLDKEVFSLVHSLPLSLTQGDMQSNLEAMMRWPPAETAGCDDTTKKILACYFADPRQTLRALQLLLHSPFSIALVERGHAAGAWVRRFHKTVGSDMIELRAYCQESRALLRLSRESKAADKLRARIDGFVWQSQNVRLTAANFFASQFIRKMTRREGATAEDICEMKKRGIANQHRHWQGLSYAEKQVCIAGAEHERKKRRRLVSESASHARSELALLEQRHRVGMKEG